MRSEEKRQKKKKRKKEMFGIDDDDAELALMKQLRALQWRKLWTSQIATMGNHSMHSEEIKSDCSEGLLSALRL